MKTSIFNIGQMVKHKTRGYSAIIIDIDVIFQPSGQKNPHLDQKKLQKKGPWYRLLVHQTKLITYVDESELEKAFIAIPISHPQLHDFLTIQSGEYCRKGSKH